MTHSDQGNLSWVLPLNFFEVEEHRNALPPACPPLWGSLLWRWEAQQEGRVDIIQKFQGSRPCHSLNGALPVLLVLLHSHTNNLTTQELLRAPYPEQTMETALQT